MAEAQGQVEIQPALNQFEAAEALAKQIDAAQQQAEKPRTEDGKFAPKAKEETKAEPDKAEAPAEAAEEAKAEETPTEEVESEIQPEPRRFKLKYKGEELEKDENEVIELAQKGHDYTQKSQALAKEREELTAKVKSESDAARAKYEQQLEVHKQTVLKLVDQEALNADLNKLALEDPAKAQQLFFKKLQIQQTVAQIEAAQQQIAAQRQSEAQEVFKKQALEAVEKLQERIPGWNNELYGKILKGSQETYGFKSEEVNAITDHRAIEVLNDALKWREYQSAKPRTVEKRVASVPKVSKPGSSEKTDPNANKLASSMARLAKEGTRKSAEEYAMALIDQGRI